MNVYHYFVSTDVDSLQEPIYTLAIIKKLQNCAPAQKKGRTLVSGPLDVLHLVLVVELVVDGELLVSTVVRTLLLGDLGDDVLGKADGEPSSLPLPHGKGEDLDKGREGDPVADSGVDRGSDGSLDRGEDGSSRDTHDDGSGGDLGESTHVTGSQDEDDGVLDRLCWQARTNNSQHHAMRMREGRARETHRRT